MSTTPTTILATALPIPADEAIAAAILGALDAKERTREAIMSAWEAMAIAGAQLAAKKQSLDHGQWLAWLRTMTPDRYAGRRRSTRDGAAFEAWQRTVRNWIRMAEIFAHCDVATIEQAHNIRQLFLLSEMQPEGGGVTIVDGTPPTLHPHDFVNRFARAGRSLREDLARVPVDGWTEEQRGKLQEELIALREVADRLEREVLAA